MYTTVPGYLYRTYAYRYMYMYTRARVVTSRPSTTRVPIAAAGTARRSRTRRSESWSEGKEEIREEPARRSSIDEFRQRDSRDAFVGSVVAKLFHITEHERAPYAAPGIRIA